MTITNKAFRKAMEKAGMSHIQLQKGDGYFYIWSERKGETFEEDMILLNSFCHQSIEDWVKDIADLAKTSKMHEEWNPSLQCVKIIL